MNAASERTGPRPWHRVALIGIVMLGVFGTAVWRHLEPGDWSPLAQRAVVFDMARLRLPANLAGPTGRLRLVHFWDPACESCNRETGTHLSYLISIYRGAAIDFYSVRRPGTRGELPAFLRGKLQALERIDGQEQIPASPAVAVWDAKGQLVYAGPYSLGAVCTSANSFIEPIIDRLLAGEIVAEPSGFLATGCYCPWRVSR